MQNYWKVCYTRITRQIKYIYSYTLEESTDKKYGIDNTSGLIRMLCEDQIDIAIANFHPMTSRNRVATFLKGLRVNWLSKPI